MLTGPKTAQTASPMILMAGIHGPIKAFSLYSSLEVNLLESRSTQIRAPIILISFQLGLQTAIELLVRVAKVFRLLIYRRVNAMSLIHAVTISTALGHLTVTNLAI